MLPLYLQGLRGLDPFHSGLTTFPQAIGILISSQIAGRIYPPRRAAPADHRRHARGRACRCRCLLFVGLETDLWWIRVIMFVRGLPMGFCFVSSQAASYAEIAPADNGRASAIFSTQRQMSASIGVALMATVLASFTTLTRDAGRPASGRSTGLPLDVRPVRRRWRCIGACWRSLMIHDEDARDDDARPAATVRRTAAAAGWRPDRRLEARRIAPRSAAVDVVAEALLRRP